MKIVKSLIVFVLLCLLYSYVVSVVQIRNYQPLDQFQGNTIAKEELLYADLSAKTHYLVGSSLTYRLKQAMLPAYYQNMAIAGSSSGYGLRKVVERGIVPQVLVLETNLLGRSKGGTKKKSSNDQVSAPLRLIKKNLPITQQKNQPVAFAINLLSQIFLRKEATTPIAKSEKAMELMSERQEEVYSEVLPDDEYTERSFTSYRSYIEQLESQGTCIVFVEMPISCALVESNLATSTRAAYKRAFPPERYHYIALPKCGEVETTDGIHLSAESAEKVATELISALSKIDCK